ncbi:hypothetical protein [Streptomyces sp. Root369]|nr:hypothetical protein [Streptomyces sp. Root369]
MQHIYDMDVRVPMRSGVALAANCRGTHRSEGECYDRKDQQ